MHVIGEGGIAQERFLMPSSSALGGEMDLWRSRILVGDDHQYIQVFNGQPFAVSGVLEPPRDLSPESDQHGTTVTPPSGDNGHGARPWMLASRLGIGGKVGEGEGEEGRAGQGGIGGDVGDVWSAREGGGEGCSSTESKNFPACIVGVHHVHGHTLNALAKGSNDHNEQVPLIAGGEEDWGEVDDWGMDIGDEDDDRDQKLHAQGRVGVGADKGGGEGDEGEERDGGVAREGQKRKSTFASAIMLQLLMAQQESEGGGGVPNIGGVTGGMGGHSSPSPPQGEGGKRGGRGKGGKGAGDADRVALGVVLSMASAAVHFVASEAGVSVPAAVIYCILGSVCKSQATGPKPYAPIILNPTH